MSLWKAIYGTAVSAALICIMCSFPHALVAQTSAGANFGTVHGTVFTSEQSGERAVVPGAKVSLRGAVFSHETLTDGTGRYRFQAVPPDTYQLRAEAPSLLGSSLVKVAAGEVLDTAIELKVEAQKDSITVTSSGSEVDPNEPSDERAVDKAVILNAPNKEERIDALLPLVPGVVRGPDGLINMKGARSSQTGYLVNSASAIDPVTGNAAINLPIDVVESVKVIADPYDPEYGRLTGAVASVETVTGNFNAFHFSLQNLMPRPRRRDGDFVGIEAATPRLTLTGPILKNKIAFTQSFEYRFIRTPVESLPPLQRDMKLESFNSFSQMDAYLTARQSLTASFALYPQKLNYLGLNTFVPQPSTPDLHQRGYMASIQHRYATGSSSMLVSQFSYKTFDADVTANSTAPYQLFVETTTGGFFDRQGRESFRTEWQEGYQFDTHGLLGSHELKVGTDFARSDYDGRTQLLPVTILGTSDLPIESITFGSTSRFDIHQNEIAWFLADKWTPFQRLTLDLGLRFDRDSVTHSTNTAPRAGFALALTRDARTLLKGGAGLFYDRVPLNTESFPLLPDRTIEALGPTGEVLDSMPYVNTISGRLRNPRSFAWNIELDRQISSAFIVRAGFQERNTVRDFVINPDASPGQGILSLSSDGHSFYREFQVEGQYKLKRHTLNVSYVRSKAYGDLNDFNEFFGNNAVAVIEPNARGRLPFDAPNRFLFWGQFQAPFKLTMMPVLDVHTGFPYSQIDQERQFVGPRDSLRFPVFDSFDLQITRPIRLPIPHKDVRARIGFSVFNLLDRFNPRDVQSDIDSYRYGALFNGVGRTFRGKFIWEF